jgi:glycerophosphoryl diester phosphodiesterase
MKIYSHRGFHVSAPENSMEAFAAAISKKADGIETDVRLTADGELALFHDRAAPDGRLVASLTHPELTHSVGFPVPTLIDALDAFPDVLWNVEIKTQDAVDATIRVLKGFRSPESLLVSSFLHPIIARVAESVNIQCGILVAHRPLDTVDIVKWCPVTMKVKRLIWDYEACDRNLIDNLASQGVRNLVYGPVAIDELTQIRDWAFEGVITDRPDLWTKS